MKIKLNKMKPIKVLPPLGLFLLAASLFIGCKKIDLVRIAAVETKSISDVTNTSVKAVGEIIDVGNGSIQAHGFCFGTTAEPIFNTNSVNLGSISQTGSFNAEISELFEDTKYYLRTFLQDETGITYGDQINFTTTGTGLGNWLFYDNGINFDGVGLNNGGSFDYAIRFTEQDLLNYVGFRISKIKFYPLTGYPTQYYAEVFAGNYPPILQYYEVVTNAVIDSWNEYTPSESYFIEPNKEVWIGIWVYNHPIGTYPGGVDAGPANPTGKGDMISFDFGDSWFALSELDPPLYHNWNLRVKVTNQKGEEFILENSSRDQDEKLVKYIKDNPESRVVTSKKLQ